MISTLDEGIWCIIAVTWWQCIMRGESSWEKNRSMRHQNSTPIWHHGDISQSKYLGVGGFSFWLIYQKCPRRADTFSNNKKVVLLELFLSIEKQLIENFQPALLQKVTAVGPRGRFGWPKEVYNNLFRPAPCHPTSILFCMYRTGNSTWAWK